MYPAIGLGIRETWELRIPPLKSLSGDAYFRTRRFQSPSPFGYRHACVCALCTSPRLQSANPKPHSSTPPLQHATSETKVALQFLEYCAAEVALQQSLFCNAEVISTKSCAATNEKLYCNFEKLRGGKGKWRFPAAFLRVSSPPRLGTHI